MSIHRYRFKKSIYRYVIIYNVDICVYCIIKYKICIFVFYSTYYVCKYPIYRKGFFNFTVEYLIIILNIAFFIILIKLYRKYNINTFFEKLKPPKANKLLLIMTLIGTINILNGSRIRSNTPANDKYRFKINIIFEYLILH